MTSTLELPDPCPTTKEEWCEYYGIHPEAHLNALIRHIMGNNAAVVSVQKAHIESLQSEIARHHRDFARISDLTHGTLEAPARPLPESRNAFRDALCDIRRIVG